jgi:hypothetical protein
MITVDPRFEISSAPTSYAIAALLLATSSLGLRLSDTQSENRKVSLIAKVIANLPNAENQNTGRNRHVGRVVVPFSHRLQAHQA